MSRATRGIRPSQGSLPCGNGWKERYYRAMSYRFLSPKDISTAHVGLWTDRSVQTEVEVLRGRTLVGDLAERLPDKARILEAGCGLGGWVRFLKDQGHDIVGIDFEEEVVARVNKDDPELAVTLGDVTALAFPDGDFDAYISLGVVEHFEEGPQVALAEAHRVLKPGGLAFVTVPFLNPFRRFVSHPVRDLYFWIQRRRGHGGQQFWEYRYTAKELSSALERQGFVIEAVEVDDYGRDLADRHIGLFADFFFLRKRASDGYELNRYGRAALRLLRPFPRLTAGGVLVVGRKPS